ncbi:MAG: 23S rRNA (guanosine(2251)-2'-O)-methyltransferase RlmB [Pyrinomonadaceae bacterium]
MKEKGKSGKGRVTSERNLSRGQNSIRQSGREDNRTNEKISPFTTPQSALIYGVLPVLESLRAGRRRIEKIMIADGARLPRLNDILDLARQKNIPFQKISRSDFLRYVEADANHQGVIALVAAADYAGAENLLNEISARENSLTVILDGVEDPRNLGAILRTVDCAGADGVFIPERRAAGLTEIVAKTSAGATEYVKIAKVTNISRLIEELKERGIWTIGTSMDAEMDYTDWDWTQKSALVLGGEGKGLHRLVAEKCDVLVKIPLLGKIESLNVSVAAGVILYEAVRQRNKKAENNKC